MEALAAALQSLPVVEVLRQVWWQPFYLQQGQLRLRAQEQRPPCSERITSAYDQAARFAPMPQSGWTGYKLHLSPTCDADTPHLSTQVETTPAATAATPMSLPIQASVCRSGRLPSQPLLDQGYIQAAHRGQSLDRYGLQIVGPLARDAVTRGPPCK